MVKFLHFHHITYLISWSLDSNFHQAFAQFFAQLGFASDIHSRFSTWNHDQSMIQDHTQWLGGKITGNRSIINGKKAWFSVRIFP